MDEAGSGTRRRGSFLETGVAFVLLLMACGAVATPARAEDEIFRAPTDAAISGAAEDLTNQFAGVESWSYPSGLLVYFKNMPAAEKIYFRATLPVGSRQDPERLEGLAHFLEHMMFTGPDGMSKAEFRRLVEDHGGSTNASTSRDRTDYKLELPASEWRFGLEWFEDLLFRHEFVEAHVEEERRAVILERDLEKARPIDFLEKWLLFPDWSKPPDFWELELGIPTERNSTIGTWESVHRAKREDLQAFHDRWYGPQNMTVAIFGRLDRDAVKAVVDASFGTVERFGEEARVQVPASPADRYRRSVHFGQRGGHRYSLTHVIPDMTPDDWAWSLFLRDLSGEHLNDVLRHERRAAYGVSTRFGSHRGHAHLTIEGNFDPEQEEDARAYIERFFEDLKADEVDPELFEALRSRVEASMLMNNQSTSELARWVRTDLYQRDVHGDRFPDVVTFVREASSAGLAQWMEERLTQDRRVVTLRRPTPLWPLVEFMLYVLVVIVTFRISRRALIRPLDLKRLVYHRKFLYSPVSTVIALAAILVVLLTGSTVIRLAVGTLDRVLIQPWDAFGVHLIWRFFVLSFLTALVLLVPASIPRKILLLEDHWRVKYFSYRSRSFHYGEIRQVERRHLVSALLDRKAWPCRPMHWGPLRRGIHLHAGRGSWFFRTRDDAELLEQLELRRNAEHERRSAEEAPDRPSHR